MGKLRRTVSNFEIACGIVMVLMAASFFVHDWYADAFCSPDHFECSSWAVMLSGFYFGVPTLIGGMIFRLNVSHAWLSQVPIVALALMFFLYWAFP